MQLRYLGVLLVLAALWGASFLFIKIGVAEMAPDTLVATRTAIGALIVMAMLYGRGLRLPTQPRALADLLFLGSIGLILPYVLITWGELHISSGMAAILNASTPLFSVLLTYVWTSEEQLSGVRLLGVAVGFVGVVVAVGIEEVSLASASTQAQLAVLLASLCYAVAGLYSRSRFRGAPALVPAAGQLVMGALVIVPLALARHGLPADILSGAWLPSPAALGSVLALAVFGTAIAYILLYWLIERIGATRTAMVTYLLPPFALLYGALFLREQITLGALFGLALVIAGILLSNSALRSLALRRPRLGHTGGSGRG